jgi:hypothetical protein
MVNPIPGFSGKLIHPNDPDYDAARRTWNSMMDKRPSVIAQCRTTGDVVAALRRALREGLEIAVRAGGHSVAGLSQTNGGMTIDLQNMSRVVVDPSARNARVGGGTLLRALDRATHEHSLATTGGMVHHTGVAGLTLGGGFGWLARLHGLACDNLTAAEVVTASGDVVRASTDENAELLWALRGGGGNFGIVTEFEFRLHPIGPILSIQQRYSIKHARSVSLAFFELFRDAPPELCGLIGIGPGRGTGQLSDGVADRELYVWCAYAGENLDEGRRLAAGLPKVARPLVEQVDVMSYPDLQAATGEGSGPGRRHYWKGSLMRDISEPFLDVFVERGLLPSEACGVELFSLGGAIARVREEDTAYSNRDATFDLLPAATWDDPRDDERNISLTRETWQALAPYAKKAVYVNDLGADTDERIGDAYGSTKLARLVALKQQWDPANVFHLNANIKPVAEATAARS